MSGEDREIIEAFAEESLELLRSSETALNAMLTAGEDERPDLWKRLLRALHTVKGSAGFLGDSVTAKQIESLTHTTEDRAKAIQHGREPYTDEGVDDLANAVEEIRALVDVLMSGEPEPESAGTGQGAVFVFDSPPPEEPGGGSVPMSFAPPPPESRPGEATAAPPPEAPKPAAAKQPAPKPTKRAAKAKTGKSSKASTEEMLRIRPERIDTLQSHFGDVLVSQLQSQALTGEMVDARESVADMVTHWRALQAKLEELSRALPSARRAELRQSLRSFGQGLKDAYKTSYQLARRAHSIDGEARGSLVNLEDGIRALKLMPLEPFLQGFASTVRAASRELGKKARLETAARGAEIDRAVLMRLKDPLVHLVRNSVGHGIEMPDERIAAGKDPRGVVRLETRVEAQRVFLHIGDDGRGLDADAVVRKAVKKGLIEPGTVLDDDGLLEVILMPGFSTREKVDKISGRGIGMDVVADTIRSVGGSISLENKPGEGATFILEVPITTSTSQGMVVRVGEARFGLPYVNVHRVMRVGKDDRTSLEGRAVVHVHGDPLALVELSGVLGVDGDPESERRGRRSAVVLRHGSRRLVLEVDEIVGAVEMLIKPLCRAFAEHPLILGAAVGADSEILPVLDVPNLFGKVTQTRGTRPTMAAAASLEEEEEERKLTVLVVDDSSTMRILERDVLQTGGYEVVLAEDGLKGLEALQTHPNIDLVVTDLNMPNCDGLEFTGRLREELDSTVPVMMVTTVDDNQTKRQAQEAGVDHYLVKREFSQESFLGAIADLLGVPMDGAK